MEPDPVGLTSESVIEEGLSGQDPIDPARCEEDHEECSLLPNEECSLLPNEECSLLPQSHPVGPTETEGDCTGCSFGGRDNMRYAVKLIVTVLCLSLLRGNFWLQQRGSMRRPNGRATLQRTLITALPVSEPRQQQPRMSPAPTPAPYTPAPTAAACVPGGKKVGTHLSLQVWTNGSVLYVYLRCIPLCPSDSGEPHVSALCLLAHCGQRGPWEQVSGLFVGPALCQSSQRHLCLCISALDTGHTGPLSSDDHT
jgi:hypothetical protein